MPFQERDVLADRSAAEEMVARSGQHGVPVIAAGDDVIIGFDRPRLERMAERVTRQAPRPRFGLFARDLPGGGVEVGGARPGSPAAQAGFRRGDVLESVDGKQIGSMADLERLLPALPRAIPIDAYVRRDGSRERLRLTL